MPRASHLLSKSWLAPTFLLLLFLALRILQSASSIGSFDLEDGFILTSSWELLHHNIWPYQAYQLTDFEGGSLIMALLSLPFTLLFGPSVFTLKMTAVLVSCVTLAGLFLLCREVFGRPVALLACALYILFPSPIYAYTMTAHGFHPDSMALQVFFLWGMARCYGRPPSRLRFFWVGAVGGFAIYFAYISAIAVIAAVAPWLWLRLKDRRRSAGPRFLCFPFLGGLLAGGAPLIIYNMANQGGGAQTYHGSILSYLYNPQGWGPAAAATREHTVDCLLRFSAMGPSGFYGTSPYPFYPHNPLFEPFFWIVALSALAAPLLWPVAARLMKRASPEAAPAGARLFNSTSLWFFALTLYIFFASGHPVERWHMVPLLVVLLAVIAARLVHLWQGGGAGRRVLVAAILAVFFAYGLQLNIQDIRLQTMGIGLKVDGRKYPHFLFRAGTVFTTQGQPHKKKILAALELNLPYEITLKDMTPDKGVGMELMQPVLESSRPLEGLRTFLQQRPEPGMAIDRHKAAGIALSQLYLKRRLTAQGMMSFVASMEDPGASSMIEAVGAAVGRLLIREQGFAAIHKGALKANRLQRFAFGMGRTLDLSSILHAPAPLCDLQGLTPHLKQAFFRGIGAGVARRLVGPVPAYFGHRFCAAVRPSFWSGVQEFGAPTSRLLPQNIVMDSILTR